tara:strand:- start:373 stop:957 length:585 start_codon:yes stop_codon:yes gene_type:complete
MGYGKSQDKLPSASTGLGSTYAMGWETGIYPPEEREGEEYVDVPFDDIEDLQDFFAKINLGYSSADSVKPRADFSSYASTSNRFSTVGLAEQTQIHTMNGISPIPAPISRPNGLGMATGGSSSEFGATRIGPGKRGGDGTQFGYSRRPLDTKDDDGLRFMSLMDLLNMSEAEKNFIKQQLRIRNLFTVIESLER